MIEAKLKSISENASPHAESFQLLKAKSLSGIGSLAIRQVILRGVYFLSMIILAHLLTPESFGLYAIIVFILQFFSTFGDVGLGAALIQKKGELTQEELSTTFWLQQAVVWLVSLVVLIFAPFATLLYPQLGSAGVWMIRVIVASFVIASLKTVPAILFEREVRFDRIARVDVVECLSFHGLAVLFAYLGMGVWSFVYAAIVRSILGVVTMSLISTWRPALIFKPSCVADLIHFGVPYQANNVLAFIKDAVTPLFVGTYAGPAAVGYVNWARTFAFAPLMISEVFGRVAFPVFSRIQEDRQRLARTIEQSMRIMTLVLFPITILLIAMAPQLIHVVYTDKWLPALRAYYFYCTSPLMIGIMLPMYSAILSLGKSMILLRMTVILLFLEWGLGVSFVMSSGFNGIAYSQPIITGIFFVIYLKCLKRQNIVLRFVANLLPQLYIAVCSGVITWLIIRQMQDGLLTVVMCGFFGIGLYAFGIVWFQQERWIEFHDHLKIILEKGNVTK
jgi:O-antigen/teichoic acid export membrane protein